MGRGLNPRVAFIYHEHASQCMFIYRTTTLGGHCAMFLYCTGHVENMDVEFKHYHEQIDSDLQPCTTSHTCSHQSDCTDAVNKPIMQRHCPAHQLTLAVQSANVIKNIQHQCTGLHWRRCAGICPCGKSMSPKVQANQCPLSSGFSSRVNYIPIAETRNTEILIAKKKTF